MTTFTPSRTATRLALLSPSRVSPGLMLASVLCAVARLYVLMKGAPSSDRAKLDSKVPSKTESAVALSKSASNTLIGALEAVGWVLENLNHPSAIPAAMATARLAMAIHIHSLPCAATPTGKTDNGRRPWTE